MHVKDMNIKLHHDMVHWYMRENAMGLLLYRLTL
jgi:hypothetical protein